MAIETVTVVGANGNLGGPLVRALLEAGEFWVSVLRRAASTSAVVAGTTAIVVDEWTVTSLTAALRGQDAVVVAFPLRSVDDHLRLAEAAAAAGVRRYFPADFGSVDARSETARALVPLFEKKETVRRRLEALAATSATGFSYTAIVGGHFFDWGLREGFLHAHLDRRQMDVLGDGDALRSSLSTLARLAAAVVAVLRRGPGDPATANKVLFVQSFCVSQHTLLAALERATEASWTVRRLDTAAFVAEHKAKADQGDRQAVEDLVYVLGLLEGDWTQKPEFAMDLLGLQDEDLDAAIAAVIAEEKK
ncbi:NmrA-like protein [Grosmannia clavigera kw1407]|uniref:NmrA-like protein n=1 Tax=Grosmannia clavigera (strain kw1407 / UAMH 11150) TaxID=655863 RepID=F0XET9_GROCL|nr:NmrA-like protein [Grosmannia clavigera kw1407]EFX04364.1 NmrA-like protein [Grosmannia clavigera kw1407]